MYKRIVYKNKVYIVIDKYTTIRLKTRRVKEAKALKHCASRAGTPVQHSLLKQGIQGAEPYMAERIDEYKKYRYSSIPSYGNQYCFVG